MTTLKRYDGMKRGVAFIPNLLTTANLFCGFFSMIQTLKGNYIFAVYLIILASLFDFLDGRVARMTGTQSDFGVEYDSLSDLTTFCMAPSLLLYKWGLSGFGYFGVAVAFLYFACGALRLARYNVQAGGVEKMDFQGLPTPAAAGTVVTYILFYREIFVAIPPLNPYPLMALLAAVAILMVSNIRYRSMKKTDQRLSFFQLVLVVSVVFAIVANHEVMLFVTGLSYIGVGLAGRIRDLNAKVQTAQVARRTQPYASPHDKPHRARRFQRRGHGRRHNNPQGETPPPQSSQSATEIGESDNIVKFKS